MSVEAPPRLDGPRRTRRCSCSALARHHHGPVGRRSWRRSPPAGGCSATTCPATAARRRRPARHHRDIAAARWRCSTRSAWSGSPTAASRSAARSARRWRCGRPSGSSGWCCAAPRALRPARRGTSGPRRCVSEGWAARRLVIGRWFTPARRPGAVARGRCCARRPPEGYAACCEALAAFDARDRLGGVRAPTLVIAGAEDLATPPATPRRSREGIPARSGQVVPGAAHLANLERPRRHAVLRDPRR